MSQIKVAKSYAKSLLDLSVEKGLLEKVKLDMELVHDTIANSHELQLMLQSPIVANAKKASILTSIFKSHVSDLTFIFIEMLTKKGREANLQEIAKSFSNQYLEYKNILKAVIISVDGVGESLKNKLKDLVKQSYQKEVVIEEVKNPSLIGGFIITVGDKQIDASVSKKLALLKNSFSENPFLAQL